jgi:hypothetical protein
MSKKIEKDKKINAKAEFHITVDWPDDCEDDVDTYVEDPVGNLVSFGRREQGLMHLDRDDLGKKNDTIRLQDGTTIEVKENREIVSVRGIIPGEFIVNCHMYYKRSEGKTTTVRVKLEKLNPQLKLVTVREVKLGQNGDEQTAFRFTVDKEGDVTSTNQLFKDICKSPGAGGGYEYEEEDYDYRGDEHLSPGGTLQ